MKNREWGWEMGGNFAQELYSFTCSWSDEQIYSHNVYPPRATLAPQGHKCCIKTPFSLHRKSCQQTCRECRAGQGRKNGRKDESFWRKWKRGRHTLSDPVHGLPLSSLLSTPAQHMDSLPPFKSLSFLLYLLSVSLSDLSLPPPPYLS